MILRIHIFSHLACIGKCRVQSELHTRLNFSMHLYSAEGICVLNSVSPVFTCGGNIIQGTCRLPGGLLNDGTYSVDIMVVRDGTVPLFRHRPALVFDVHDLERRDGWYGKWPGLVRPRLPWSTREWSADAVTAPGPIP